VLGDYPNYYCEFDDRDLRIHGDQLGLLFITHVYFQISNLVW